jgi:hypothetical protein
LVLFSRIELDLIDGANDEDSGAVVSSRKEPDMLGLIILSILAVAVVLATLVVAKRDDYRPVPARMADSTLARPESPAPVPISRLG